MSRFFKCFAAVLAYWALMFLGPAIVMIFNDIGYNLTGGGWGPDSLMRKILQFFSQPISCVLACSAITSILKGTHKPLISINCVIASCMCTLFAFTATEPTQMWAMIISSLASAITAAYQSKNTENPETENALLKSREENAKLIKEIEQLKKESNYSAKQLYLLNLITDKFGSSIDGLLESIYKNLLIANGKTAEEAKHDLQEKLEKENFTVNS